MRSATRSPTCSRVSGSTLLPFSEVVEALPLRALKRAARARVRLDDSIYGMIADRRDPRRLAA